MFRSSFFAAVVFASSAFAGPENVLRNGSFEGGLLYWHQIDAKNDTLVKDAAVGEYALRIAKGNVMSAPFVAVRGEPMTVSFFVKGEAPGRVGVQMPPSAREVGTKAHRLWQREAEQSAEIGTEWKRVSFTWKADVPADGFWPFPHYLVQIGGYDRPILVDGVTVTVGSEGTPAYVPRRAVEVVADCTNLSGWESAWGNAFKKGATAEMAAHVSNPGSEPRTVTVRWQLVDYEGVQAVTAPVDAKVTIAPGKTFAAKTSLPLTRTGLVFARLSALDEKGAEIDRSDFPLTSIPYPMAATKPDFRERFGASFAGGLGVIEKMQLIGFGWARWQPHANGEDHLPVKPANLEDVKTWDFHWEDKALDRNESHGISSHLVLYPPPKWIMEKGSPLPTDMRWAAEDPRWDDLGTETVWDKFVRASAEHYAGQSIIFEIENEPEFDRWLDAKLGEVYAKFTIRTARMLRKYAPKKPIMVNNVYGIPSPVNGFFFRAGGLKFIDVMSWHDYHAGWLADAQAIRRMRQNMDEAGGKNVELWFNEGWAFTNTAVDEPIACTHLTAAQSTNEQADSVAEMTISGQEKTVLFHIAYEDHGQSFWDYSGPGQMLWDWYGYPNPLVGMWNVLNHHIGESDEVGFVRPPGANLAIFQDLRNGRGVVIAYADRDAKGDAAVELPPMGAAWISEDIMGNASAAPKRIVLSKTGRPVLLYTSAKTAGKAMLAAMEALDRKHASFVTQAARGAAPVWKLPPVWEGKAKGESEGSVAMADGKPVWKLEQLWPDDWKKPGNFRAMTWTGTDWNVKDGGFGGQPGAGLKDGALTFGTRAPHGPGNDRHLRTAGLTFIAPRDGTYALHGAAAARMWDSKNNTTLHLLKRAGGMVEKVVDVTVANNAETSLEGRSVELTAGDELTLLPQIDGMFAGGDLKLKDFSLSLSDATAPPANQGYRLPAAWEGREKGNAAGNPAAADGQPIWRLDRLYPGDANLTSNYSPMVWNGTVWTAPDHSQGGHPSARVEDGKVNLAALGSWGGNEFNFPKIPALAFIAPNAGRYKVAGSARSKPWEGNAKSIPLSLRKRDTQRAAEITWFSLPRDGSPVELKAEVDLAAGDELLFVPMMQGLDNNASNVSIEALSITVDR